MRRNVQQHYFREQFEKLKAAGFNSLQATAGQAAPCLMRMANRTVVTKPPVVVNDSYAVDEYNASNFLLPRSISTWQKSQVGMPLVVLQKIRWALAHPPDSNHA